MQVPTEAFVEVARHRPVTTIRGSHLTEQHDTAARSSAVATPLLAPYGAIEAELGRDADTVALHLAGPGGERLTARLDGSAVTLEITTDRTTKHRSRRHGRARRPDALALTLTGRQLTALVRERGAWVARARADLTGRVDPHDPGWLEGLTSRCEASAGTVTWRAGTFGQLGLRDLRLVTHADGTPYRRDGAVFLSATSAGPGFFDTAHMSVWRLDPGSHDLTHASDLWFERTDRAGVYGDHAGHVLADGERWLVATSTWGDFVPPDSDRGGGKRWVDVTLAETGADVLSGPHVLPTRPLPLPTGDLTSVGTWDPHLLRQYDEWLVGFVSAREYFDFHPVLAAGDALDRLAFVAATPDRTATEGTTLLPTDDGLRVLASDGPDNPPAVRRRYPVFDGAFTETGTLDAPYLSNIGWPTLVPPGPGQPDWLLVTFDGTPHGGRLAGYGTHGDVVVLSPPNP